MSLMGIDIGSTGTKAILFRADGRILGQAYREYPELRPQPGWFELDPDQVWEAFTEVVAQAASHQEADPVQSLCISAMGEAFTPVDVQGNFLYNTILSQDGRAQEQVEELGEALGEEALFHVTGMPLHPSFTLSKMMWLRENYPELHTNTHKYLLWPDLVLFKLGLPPRLDWTLAGRTMAFDVVNKQWSAEILAAVEFDAVLLADPIEPGYTVGKVPTDWADSLGLPADCLVVAGGHDQAMNALGAGVIEEGLAVDGMGTVECITVAFDKPVLSEVMQQFGYCCYPHVVGDMYISLAFNYSSGSILRWFRDNFSEADRHRATQQGRDVYEIILSDLPEGPTELLLVPYFAGSGTPYMDAQARGALVGLTIGTDRKTFIKGLLEGICLDLRLNIDSLVQAGVDIQRLRATGGGAKSPYWLQLKADITGKEVVTLNVSESGCLAGAMLGGVATEVYDSVPQAVQQLVRERTLYKPDPEMHQRYERYFELYKQLWPQVREIIHQL